MNYHAKEVGWEIVKDRPRKQNATMLSFGFYAPLWAFCLPGVCFLGENRKIRLRPSL